MLSATPQIHGDFQHTLPISNFFTPTHPGLPGLCRWLPLVQPQNPLSSLGHHVDRPVAFPPHLSQLGSATHQVVQGALGAGTKRPANLTHADMDIMWWGWGVVHEDG